MSEVIEAAERLSGRRIAVKASPRRAGDPAELVADASLIGKRLAWKLRFDALQTMILPTLRWEEARTGRQAISTTQNNDTPLMFGRSAVALDRGRPALAETATSRDRARIGRQGRGRRACLIEATH